MTWYTMYIHNVYLSFQTIKLDLQQSIHKISFILYISLLFYIQLLQPLSIRFNTVMEYLNNKSLRSDDTLQKKLLFLLESLCGVASATSSILIRIVFPFLLPLLYSCVQLLQVFSDSQDISLIIFKLFENVTENFTIFLSDVSCCTYVIVVFIV